MPFNEAIQYIKAHPAQFSDSDMGRHILKLIKQGNTRRLRRYWQGSKANETLKTTSSWLAGKPVGAP